MKLSIKTKARKERRHARHEGAEGTYDAAFLRKYSRLKNANYFRRNYQDRSIGLRNQVTIFATDLHVWYRY